MPSNIEAITAAYTSGVLRLTIPVAERAKPRKIAVSTMSNTPSGRRRTVRSSRPRPRTASPSLYNPGHGRHLYRPSTWTTEFWAVVLADPDLLDEAFAEVMASWHSGPPSAPPGTLTANLAGPTRSHQKHAGVLGGHVGRR